jgi:hypothetical protein
MKRRRWIELILFLSSILCSQVCSMPRSRPDAAIYMMTLTNGLRDFGWTWVFRPTHANQALSAALNADLDGCRVLWRGNAPTDIGPLALQVQAGVLSVQGAMLTTASTQDEIHLDGGNAVHRTSFSPITPAAVMNLGISSHRASWSTHANQALSAALRADFDSVVPAAVSRRCFPQDGALKGLKCGSTREATPLRC